jgi:hypothetical protein
MGNSHMIDKFVYFCDVHYGSQPRNRSDNYDESILKKLRFTFSLARKHKCHIICGGDLFDTPRTKTSEIVSMVKLFSEYKDLQIYSLRGNNSHDGIGDQSGLMVLHHAGLLKVPTEDYIDFENSRIIFAHSGYDYDKIKSLKSTTKCVILSTHEMIVKSPVPFAHILIDDFKTDADVILLAHYHPYQGIFYRKSDNRLFIGIGSIARRKKIAHEMERIPKIAFIAVNERMEIKVQEIDIPGVEKDVWLEKTQFEVELEEEHIQMGDEIEKMKQIIDEDSVGLSLNQQIEFYGNKMKIDCNILEYCLKNLG